ncbi:cysteine-rich receptor-like protein kinase 25 [Tripterygium wilfordii]|uniref:Cysteine-rich receptor-like protein kinase 25 n=1 Tax=Tripterygium wilfordii TaxID=458696 RepID=A0A7J7C4F2_TRIWF|nr:cysteine-rich receptor-like protein kinase 25 [Tripterygium wilfordii]
MMFPLLAIAIFGLISTSVSQPTYNSHACLGSSNITASNQFQSNLSSLLDSLSSRSSTNSFYQDSSNGIYSLYLCRGDVPQTTCQTCVANASQQIIQNCQFNQSAIIWYDECILRYSTDDFFGVVQTYPRVLMWNVQNTTSPDEPNVGALALIYNLVDSVPYTGTMFGANESAGNNGSQPRYGLVQCSRDLNSSACSSCLAQLTDASNQCCRGKVGWRILAPSCNLRYEEYKFYQQPSTPVGPTPSVPDSGNEGTDEDSKDDPADRPTMSNVALMLGSNSVTLPKPLAPPHHAGRFMIMSDQSSTKELGTGSQSSEQSSTTVPR